MIGIIVMVIISALSLGSTAPPPLVHRVRPWSHIWPMIYEGKWCGSFVGECTGWRQPFRALSPLATAW